jgi:hypothetical protein
MSSTNFHLDRPPQEYLDELHDIDVPRLYDPALSREQRLNLIQLTRKRLRQWRNGVEALVEKIGERYGAENADEQRLAQAPYQLLATLGKQLDEAIDELETIVKKGRVVPEGFVFGDRIFGNPESGEWHLGTRADAERFDEMLSVHRRLSQLMEEYKPLVQKMKVIQQRIKEMKNDLRNWMQEYQQKQSTGYIATRLAGLLILALLLLAAGAFFFTSEQIVVATETDRVLGVLLIVAGVVFTIAAIVIYRRRSRRLNELREDIQAGKQRLRQYKKDFQEQKRHYFPINQLVTDLRADYRDLRATFEQPA